MKNLFVILIICLFSQLRAFAEYSSICPNIKQTPNNSAAIIGKLTGYDFFSVKAYEIYFKNYIKKNNKSDVKIQIKAKNINALKAGEFKEVRVKADKFRLNDYTVSDFKAKTLCPYNKISQIDNNILFPYSIPVEYSAVITNEDLQSIVKSQKVSESLGMVKNTDWRIENSKIKIIVEYNALFTTIKLTLSTGLKLKNGKIFFDSVEGINTPFNVDVNKISSILNIYNPLTEIVKISANTFVYLTYDDIEIKNDKIYIKGMFLIPQNCDINK